MKRRPPRSTRPDTLFPDRTPFRSMAMDLGSGATREIDPQWDRSADGIVLSADGRTIYTTAQDMGEHPLFAVDIASGAATEVIGNGSIGDFSIEIGRAHV